MTTTHATNEQLELGLAGLKMTAAEPRSRIARANWWFAQMRGVVERAMDWSLPAQSRPEQIWIPGATREAGA